MHSYWICEGQEPIVVVALLSLPFFAIVTITIIIFLDSLCLLALFCVYHHMAGVYMASWIALVAAGMILVYMYYYDCYL